MRMDSSPSSYHGLNAQSSESGQLKTIRIALFVVGVLSVAALAVGIMALLKKDDKSSSCLDPQGFFKCIGGSYCVGILKSSPPQNTKEYYTSASNGIEFDRLTFIPAGGPALAPSGMFMHMEIHGGCNTKPCGFHEDELYTPTPANGLQWEGFTVNRTGAATGQQVFYENLYFSPGCDQYIKVVKGQLVSKNNSTDALKPQAVLCHNVCHRTSEADYYKGIAGGYAGAQTEL